MISRAKLLKPSNLNGGNNVACMKNGDLPERAAILLHLAHMTALASGGTAAVVAVAIRKYRKFKLMLACKSSCQRS